MATIDFTSNYEDLSTERGFQFKFYCQKCGNGYLSSFQSSTVGLATSALEAAGNLLGGLFGRAAAGAHEIQRMIGGPQHDAALRDAVAEIRPKFRQCTRCGQWVCEPVCWNGKESLCEGCAPDMDEETSAARAAAAREQVQEKARQMDWVQGRDLAERHTATCPSCGKATPRGKFCAECGAPLAAATVRCWACDGEMPLAAKFCPQCGEKQR